MSKDEQIPSWFKSEVNTVLQRLMALSLDRSPPYDTIKLTSQAWLEAIWSSNINWIQEDDAWRIKETGLEMARRVTVWPSPKMFLEMLPQRIPRAKLPEPEYPKELAKENFRKIYELLATTYKKMPK